MTTWQTQRPTVGQCASRKRTVTHRDIELFTEMTGDGNPLHYDAAAAERSRFGGIIVQSGVTTGILNAVVAVGEELPGPGSVFLEAHWRFLAPVRPGDEIVGSLEVTGVRDDKPITHLETVVTLADGTVVLSGPAVCYTSKPGSMTASSPHPQAIRYTP